MVTSRLLLQQFLEGSRYLPFTVSLSSKSATRGFTQPCRLFAHLEEHGEKYAAPEPEAEPEDDMEPDEEE